MKLADYLLDQLVRYGVTDIFGIPGGVVLDFLYAQSLRNDEICAHLLFHEQDAAYAAIGYAQAEKRLGVAFATRGPGILNMVTPITDAYHDSVPLLVVTAHTAPNHQEQMRVVNEQEVDTGRIFKSIAKGVFRLDGLQCAAKCIQDVCTIAMEDRQGPVVLDVDASLWNGKLRKNTAKRAAKDILRVLSAAQRPVLLIGEGVRKAEKRIRLFAERNHLPVLSSRGAQDVMPDSPMYFGYVGSHGIRYANFIISKADCIVALGNRLAFPLQSESFGKIFRQAELLRIDIDPNEFRRVFPHEIGYALDLRTLENSFGEMQVETKGNWLEICNHLRAVLQTHDMELPARLLAGILKQISFCKIFVSDVGNHGFWLSRAYVFARCTQRIMYSRSLGVVGCSLGKAIGAYYVSRQPVACFCGDQGLQYALAELQYISHNHLPIWIIVLNNHSLGMIKTKQNQKYNGRHFLTTCSSGYSAPSFEAIADVYRIPYHHIGEDNTRLGEAAAQTDGPHFVEIEVEDTVDLEVCLPQGRPCQDMEPKLENALYEQLDSL